MMIENECHGNGKQFKSNIIVNEKTLYKRNVPKESPRNSSAKYDGVVLILRWPSEYWKQIKSGLKAQLDCLLSESKRKCETD